MLVWEETLHKHCLWNMYIILYINPNCSHACYHPLMIEVDEIPCPLPQQTLYNEADAYGMEHISVNCKSTTSTRPSIFSQEQEEMAYHTRSNSFPSRPHPIIEELDAHLCRLRSSEATSTSSSSSISHKITGLQELHDCVDRLLLLPLTQQALAQEHHEKWANELLDGSLMILDVCGTAKDALLQTKECVQELQSIIRRRGGKSSGLTSEVRKYLTSRKIVKKASHKGMGNLKESAFSSLNKDNETITIVSKLRDVEAVTRTVFESVLSFISGPKSQPSSWSLISKMMQPKRVAFEEQTEENEFSLVDAALLSLIKTSKSQPKSADNAHNQLDKLESCIQDHEEGLECLFRHMIKTRVSLLNILNH